MRKLQNRHFLPSFLPRFRPLGRTLNIKAPTERSEKSALHCSNHWSVFGKETDQKGEASRTLKLTAKAGILIIENLLDDDDLGLNIEGVRTNTG